MGTGHPMTEEQVLFIRKNFADMRNQDLADAAGVSKSAISRVQKRFRLRKSPEQRHKMLTLAGKASAVARDNRPLNITPDVIAKRAAAYKRTFREELIRTKWGLEQRTKINVHQEPRKKQRQRSYLKLLGYILDEKNCIAYWTENTTRAVRMEKYTERSRCYYKFLPYENEHQREPEDQQVAG